MLHAGIYYSANTHKASFCLKGNQLWKSFCKTHNIPVLETGKVLVARNKKDLEQLHIIYDRATQNGATVSWLNQNDLNQKEPLAKTYQKALWVKDTASVDSQKILTKLTELISKNAVQIKLNTAFKKKLSDTCISTTTGIQHFDILINCTGAYSDKIAHQFGLGLNYRLIPFKGIYYLLSNTLSESIHSHIYPVPNLKNPFLGIHFTKSITGAVYLGPTAIPAFGPENYTITDGLLNKDIASILYADSILFLKNNKFRSAALTEPKYYIKYFFYKKAAELVKTLNIRDITPSTKVGIRPQLVNWKTKELVMDFLIEKGPTSIHILNAISPAFTSAPAFANYIRTKILKEFNLN